MSKVPDLDLLQQFQITGDLQNIVVHKVGHIHDTFISEWVDDGRSVRYVHQCLNEVVFHDVDLVMRNVKRVLQLAGETLTVPRVVLSVEGAPLVRDCDDRAWRTYTFVEGTKSYMTCASVEQAFEAGRVCGEFQNVLATLNSEEYPEVIPRFSDLGYRFEQLDEAVALDPEGRLSSVSSEVEFAMTRRSDVQVIQDAVDSGDVPRRVTHNDPKFNNVLFDINTGKGVCVVDYDTCMIGNLLYDFGDFIRTSAASAPEEETDLSKVEVKVDLYRELSKGYLSAIQHLITARERELLVRAPQSLTLVLGIRFLTDFINGDKYFKVSHPKANLDRARNQFKLVESIESSDMTITL